MQHGLIYIYIYYFGCRIGLSPSNLRKAPAAFFAATPKAAKQLFESDNTRTLEVDRDPASMFQLF